jgi:hypothetical protein
MCILRGNNLAAWTEVEKKKKKKKKNMGSEGVLQKFRLGLGFGIRCGNGVLDREHGGCVI